MKATLRQMGNSQGVIIPKALIAQFGFEGEIDMQVTPEGLVLTKPQAPVRAGWAEASQKLALEQDDALVWPEIANDDDAALQW